MGSRALFRRQLIDMRWQLISFGCGMVLYAAVIALLFPSMREALGQLQYPQEIGRFFGLERFDFADPRVYFSGEFFASGSVIVVIYAAIAATGALAGDEGRGGLEIVLAQPISRRRVFMARALAVATGAVLIVAAVLLGWLATVPFIEIGPRLTLPELLLATFALLPITLAVIGLGLLLGAIAPTRGAAAGMLTVLIVATYLANSLAGTIDAVSWLRYISPFWYADLGAVLTSGIDPAHLAVLLGVAVGATYLGMRAFERREIGTHRWQLPLPRRM